MGCGAVAVLVGIAAIVFVVKAKDLLSWTMEKLEAQIIAALPADVSADERQRLDRGFDAAIAKIRAGEIEPPSLTALQRQLQLAAEKAPRRTLTREDVLDLLSALDHATRAFLTRDSKVTHFAWAVVDRVPGRQIHLTNGDGTRTFVAIHMHENRLYILDATVPPRAPEPGLFQQSLQFLDKDGKPTTNPADFETGFLLPFGGHKGYALAVISDLLSGPLAGADAYPGVVERAGLFLFGVSTTAFRDAASYRKAVAKFVARVKGVPPAQGFDEVLMPGEPENRARKEREVSGIPVPDKTWKAVSELADELGVDISKLLG